MKWQFLLAFGMLAVAWLAAIFPAAIPVLLVAAAGAALFVRSPAAAISAVLLATVLGEFARIPLGGVSVLPVDVLAPAVFLAWLATKCSRREPIRLNRSGWLLLGFWLAALISIILGSAELARDQLLAAAQHFIRFVSISSLFFVARDLRPAAQKILAVFAATGLLLSLSGFVILHFFYDFSKSGLAQLGWDPHIGRLTAAWLDPNFLAGGLAFILGLLGAQFLLLEKSKTRWLWQAGYLAAAGIIFAAFLLTYSRSGLLAFGMTGLVLGLLRSRALLAAGIGAAVLGLAISPRLQERVGELVQSAASIGSASQEVLDPTAALRVASWREGIRIFEANPVFGVGYGAYAAHQNFVAGRSNAATGSDWSLLTVAATTGSVGTLLFLAWLASLAGDGFAGRKKPAGLGFLAGLAGLLIHSIFVNSLLFPPILLFLVVAGGLAAPVAETRKPH